MSVWERSNEYPVCDTLRGSSSNNSSSGNSVRGAVIDAFFAPPQPLACTQASDAFKFRCETCNYGTDKKGNLYVHLKSIKHQTAIRASPDGPVATATATALTVEDDTQSTVSDLTDPTAFASSRNNDPADFELKKQAVGQTLRQALSQLSLADLLHTSSQYQVFVPPKANQTEFIDLLCAEFDKYWPVLLLKRLPDLRAMCKELKITGTATQNKPTVCLRLMTHFASSCTIKPYLATNAPTAVVPAATSATTEHTSGVLADLVKQKQLIEQQMASALATQRQDVASASFSSKQFFPTQPPRTSVSAPSLSPAKAADEEKAEVSSGSTVTMDLPANDSRKRKQPIPKNVRVIVWNHYIGEDIIKHRCLCCKKVVISNTSFEVGHVISDKNGGTHEINNLRPICFACNHSMGSENMIDFVVKYGLYIG
jgi:hypothetical protein